MPPHPLWHRRLAEIRHILEQWPAPILDRAAIEQLFGVRRRSAITLLAALDGYKVGKTYLVERATLLARLEEIAGPKIERAATRRRVQVSDHLKAMKALAKPTLIRIALPPPPAQLEDPRLPAGVTVAATIEEGGNRMVFAYQSAKELLGQIYTLATTAANDYAAFERAIIVETRHQDAVVRPVGAEHPVGSTQAESC